MKVNPKPYKPAEWANIRAVRSSQGDDATGLVLANKKVAAWYRDSLQIIKIIYDRAFDFLQETIAGSDGKISLPVNIQEVADKCGFTISFEELPNLAQSNRISAVAQLQMRRKLVGDGEITGTIRLASDLSETSARFSIAHELGHYVLREHSPIGLNYMLAACPGLYPLADTDELLADLFAYGLLLPYPSFLMLKEEYEQDDSRWPVDFSDWIAYLQERTQMPQYHVVLAYQGIKQYSLAKKLEYAEEKTPLYLKKLIAGLFEKKLTKDQIIEALKFERQKPEEGGSGAVEGIGPEIWKLQENIQEIVEMVQDGLSTGFPCDDLLFEDEEVPESELPLGWEKKIVQNLYQQGMSIGFIIDATGADVFQYIKEIENAESRSGQ